MTTEGILLVQEPEVPDVVAKTYKRIKEGFQIDFVPNFFKAQAHRPELLQNTWSNVESILIQGQVPRVIKEMIFTAISRANRCDYCEAAHLAFCKVLGADKQSREAIIQNLDAIRPLRTQAIIKFALKAGTFPVQLTQADREDLKKQGLSDAEIQEIVTMASFANYANVIAGSFQVEIDPEFQEILGVEYRFNP